MFYSLTSETLSVSGEFAFGVLKYVREALIYECRKVKNKNKSQFDHFDSILVRGKEEIVLVQNLNQVGVRGRKA